MAAILGISRSTLYNIFKKIEKGSLLWTIIFMIMAKIKEILSD